MAKRKVMCTSTGCIEYAPERYRDLGIDIIRIHVNFNGKEYLEGLDLDPIKFYEELASIEDPKNNLPTTAMPDTEKIKEHFENAYAEGYDEVIVIALSSKLGGTYNLIRLIAQDFADRMKITVIDSKITSFGEGLLAIKAVEMIEKGIDTWFALDTYELTLYREFDYVVLISGDADHEMLARKLKALKTHTILLTWDPAGTGSTSRFLSEEACTHIDIMKLAGKEPDLLKKITNRK